ncbi:ComEA family DNA-binding protein [Pedobacter sandarakinus]|uniref:ComEA family DNA-binding protein n=1 Tax=Pedobacter sandarakinus TaxID=353156 RepID=UPI0022455330|nr:helix-hairpin-helix domain-containing protein [Pedobacter sandarakinus]MCX2574713.1 helix-hairpin-helix domain-containing protein [Pedobacter sandarakinus]
MRFWLNKYFGFNKGEYNGLIVLITIILLVKLLPLLYYQLQPSHTDPPDLTDQIQKLTIANLKNSNFSSRNYQPKINKKGLLFNFDPNTLAATGWQQLGLSPKQAKSIVNYTSRGGRFYKPEDLQKAYTISPEMYQKLLPYVKIIDQPSAFDKQQFEAKIPTAKKSLTLIDINSADSAELDQIRGIGGAFANRILKYRQRLGGFHKKEQLLEVYGLDSVKYAEIQNQVSISAVTIAKININTAQFNDLRSNPYLSFKQINAIIQFRKQHGNYSGPADLLKVAILNQQTIDKIIPYISF